MHVLSARTVVSRSLSQADQEAPRILTGSGSREMSMWTVDP